MRKKLLSLLVLIVFLLSFVTACAKPNQNTVNSKQEQTNQTNDKQQKKDNDDEKDKDTNDDKDDDKDNTDDDKNDKNDKDNTSDEDLIDEEGQYTSKEEVALYIHTYKKLPSNYITKSKAKNLGWDSKKGNLFEVTDGKSIGGDKFSNREGKLPNKDGRKWYECDIDYDGGRRGAKRIVYSNDGLIYYTDDHYETFTLLYEGE